MKLVTVIAQQDDVASLIDALRQADFRLTRLETAGGFLRRGNATVLVGVDSDQVDEVLRIVRETCQSRTVTTGGDRAVRTGAATVMVLNVGRFERL
ncbi:MAG: cyclic-di-AMP receptor [Chloroflexi bacterium]|nr:cyclic-di-AMP receptor [Chloroflexota bacterium]